MRLKDKVAIVTGGTQGIGRATVRRLAADGAIVVVVASADLMRARVVADEVIAAGGSAVPKVADVRKSSELRQLVAEVTAELPPIDILVNGAGVFLPSPAGEANEDDVDRMIDINLKGTFMAINAVVPAMKARQSGKIVSIASVASSMGVGTYAIYCGTKAAVSMMTRALACELAPHGINVNAVAPGNTATPMNESIRTSPQFKPMLDAMTARTPSGRTFSTPEEIAAMVAFLVSDEARSMHGSTVLMDEGFSAGL